MLKTTSFAERLKISRTRAGMGIREVGKFAGVSQRCAYRWETGEAFPKIDNIPLLADALGVSPAWLAWGIGLE